MLNVLIVGLGGFIGSASRYLLSGWVHKIANNALFPYGTLVVNVLGCLCIGFLAGLAESRHVFTSEMRIFVFIGILGGFTTFSSFGYETFALAENGEMIAMIANICLQVCLGLGAVWLGNVTSRLF